MRGGDGSDAFMLNPSSTGWTGATVVFTIEGGAGDDYVTSTGTWSPFLAARDSPPRSRSARAATWWSWACTGWAPI
jgi:hypothetical protein